MISPFSFLNCDGRAEVIVSGVIIPIYAISTSPYETMVYGSKYVFSSPIFAKLQDMYFVSDSS